MENAEKIKAFLSNISQLITAFSIIVGAIVAFEKWSKGKLTKWLMKTVLDEINGIKEHIKKVELDNLKLVIMSDNIPLEERLTAGERYIEQGGNGGIKIHVKLLKQEYEKNIKHDE